jgi:hypothetical protein
MKFYGWEISFEKIITKIREYELTIIKKCTLFSSLFAFNFNLSTYIITIVSLSVYVFISDDNRLDPSTAYVCLSLFNAIRIPFRMLGITIANLISVNFLRPAFSLAYTKNLVKNFLWLIYSKVESCIGKNREFSLSGRTRRKSNYK